MAPKNNKRKLRITSNKNNNKGINLRETLIKECDEKATTSSQNSLNDEKKPSTSRQEKSVLLRPKTDKIPKDPMYFREKPTSETPISQLAGQKLRVRVQTPEITSQNPTNCKEPTELENPKLKIDILGKILQLMTSDFKSDLCFTLEYMLNIFDKEENKKNLVIQDILGFFLENLNNCNKDDLNYIKKKTSGLLLPKELISILVRQDDTILEQFEIGKGGFGTVVSGIFEPANGLCLKVAVKTANKGREDILKNEAIIMSQLDHPNIVKILGFQKKPMKLVMEYLECKNLAEFLSENKVPQRCLYDMILDILTGMEFMSKKKFIHRDLAARNIFINSLFRCKIGDFGLSCYVGDTNGVFIEEDGKRIYGYVVPPESQITGHFTTKSDIWAMAIVIWEMFYMHHSCYEVCLAHLSKLVFFGAFSLPPPPNCPSVLYNYIMEDLMNENPELRPDFSDIIRVLTRFISLD